MRKKELSVSEHAGEKMATVIGMLVRFPRDYIPTTSHLEREFTGIADKSRSILKESGGQKGIEALYHAMPAEMHTAFLECSSLLAHFLLGYGDHVLAPISILDLVIGAREDPELLNLLSTWADMSKPVESSGENIMEGHAAALFDRAKRRLRAKKTPFAKTISTLLGPESLEWLSSESQEGMPKLQPHEFSRVEWVALEFIGHQVGIEDELSRFEKIDQECAKGVVALCWTLVALAGHMDPGIFVLENVSHVSSSRSEHFTISSGDSTHTMIEFVPESLRTMLEIVREALTESDISACDLMWLASGLAKVRTKSSGQGLAEQISVRRRYSVFLSHRGCDARLSLLNKVASLTPGHGIFLDCLTFPRGIINRKFVMESLTSADRVAIVETAAYDGSEWCRKERWVANALASRELVRVDRISLTEALATLHRMSAPDTTPKLSPTPLRYRFSHRILSDLHYWARNPNAETLSKNTLFAAALKPMEDLIRCDLSDTNPWSAETVAREVLKGLQTVVELTSDVDAWSMAVQCAVGALGCKASARSKMSVRQGIDQMNEALRKLVTDGILPHLWSHCSTHHALALLAIVVAADLAEYRSEPELQRVAAAALAGLATVRDGVVLLDVRSPGRLRDARLQFLLTLVANNIGSLGIIQNANDTVHNREVGGQTLAIFPCVTIHPGMEALFPELDA